MPHDCHFSHFVANFWQLVQPIKFVIAGLFAREGNQLNHLFIGLEEVYFGEDQRGQVVRCARCSSSVFRKITISSELHRVDSR